MNGAYYQALASDGDGTLTRHGQLAPRTVAALKRFRASGRAVILVTGEVRNDFKELSKTGLFDRVIGENGAVFYRPGERRGVCLCQEVPSALVRALRRRHVEPLTVGRCTVATKRRHQRLLEDLLRELGLPWQITLNRTTVMLQPPEVSKATGLKQALDELGLAARRVVGIGDGENDLDLALACGYGVAVRDAVALLRSQVDHVTRGRGPAGVVELIDQILANKLPRPTRRRRLAG